MSVDVNQDGFGFSSLHGEGHRIDFKLKKNVCAEDFNLNDEPL